MLRSMLWRSDCIHCCVSARASRRERSWAKRASSSSSVRAGAGAGAGFDALAGF